MTTDIQLPTFKNSDSARNAAVQARVAALKQTGALPESREGGVTYLKFNGNDGSMTVGREANEITADQQFVVPLESAFAACTNWAKGSPVKKITVKILEGAAPQPPEGEPRVGDLPKPNQRDGWDTSLGLRLTGINGDLKGVETEYASPAQAQSQEIAALIGEMTTRASELPEGDGTFNAIVTLSSGSYHNKAYSKRVWYPLFRIIAWTDGEKIVPVTPYIAGKGSDQSAEEGTNFLE